MYTVIFALILFTTVFCQQGTSRSDLERQALRRINTLTEREVEFLGMMNQAIHYYAKGKKALSGQPDLLDYWTVLNKFEFQRLHEELSEIKELKKNLINAVIKAFPEHKAFLDAATTDLSITDFVASDAALSTAYTELAAADSATIFDASADRAISAFDWRRAINIVSVIANGIASGDDLTKVLFRVVKGLQEQGLFKGRAGRIIEIAMQVGPLLSALKEGSDPQKRTETKWALVRMGVSLLADNTKGKLSEIARMAGKFIDENTASIQSGDKLAIFKGLLTNLHLYLSQSRNPFLQQIAVQAKANLDNPKMNPRTALLTTLQNLAVQFLKESKNPALKAAGAVLEMVVNGQAPPDGQAPQIDPTAVTQALDDPNSLGAQELLADF